ncbi:MAG: hypothetical protein ACAI35_28150 [Candidatus Methylacidiphilales bacterium]
MHPEIRQAGPGSCLSCNSFLDQHSVNCGG